MSGNRRLFVCKHCDSLLELFRGKGSLPSCCGETMTELAPNEECFTDVAALFDMIGADKMPDMRSSAGEF